MDKHKFLEMLVPYPVTSACLSHYIRWFVDQPTNDVKDNDLILALRKEETWRLIRLEECLSRACEILKLTVPEFRDALGFNNDLLSSDTEKIHDILAEPIMVVILADSGFESIRKLPRFIKEVDQRIPAADLVAERAGVRYAIEVKTVHVENNPSPQPGVLMGDSLIPSWWSVMFHNNVVTKIEDKNRRVLQQLANVRRHYKCDFSVLALYYRRLGPSTLMSLSSYEGELTAIKDLYPEIDHFIVKSYYDPPIFWPPLES